VSSGQPTAERCGNSGCPGALLQGRHCLEHLTPEEFGAAVTRLRGGDLLNARNATITRERLEALLEALRGDDGRPVLPAADFRAATFSSYAVFSEVTFSDRADFDEATFDGYAPFRGATFSRDARFRDVTFSSDARFAGATFSGYAGFDGVTFSGDADFDGLTFSGDAGFRGATFSDDARFGGTTFDGDAVFGRVAFNDRAVFGGATFNRRAVFSGATFSGDAVFHGATFDGGALFDWATFSANAFFGGGTFTGDAVSDWATFSANAVFGGATFSGDAVFHGVTFAGRADFDGVTFYRTASFHMATFHRARELGPLVVGELLALDDCVFAERVTIEAAATIVSARAATFAAGAHLRVRWAEIALDDADFARVSTLSGATTSPLESDPPLALALALVADGRHSRPEPRPRLITLRGAHVSALSLSELDLHPAVSSARTASSR
jgi:hypothetical protein